MSKKDNIPLGVQQEFDDVDYWGKLSKTKIVPGTNLSEYEWMKRFMHESYANNFDRQDNSKNLLKKKEQKQWATRNNNNTNRDALNVIKKSGKIATLLQIAEEESTQSGNDWKKQFRTNDYDAAAKKLMLDTLKSLGLEYNELYVKVLLRFNYRLKTLISYIRADIKAQKKKCAACGKLKWKTEYYKRSESKDKLTASCIDCIKKRRKSE